MATSQCSKRQITLHVAIKEEILITNNKSQCGKRRITIQLYYIEQHNTNKKHTMCSILSEMKTIPSFLIISYYCSQLIADIYFSAFLTFD